MKLWIKDLWWCVRAFRFLRRAHRLGVETDMDLRMVKR